MRRHFEEEVINILEMFFFVWKPLTFTWCEINTLQIDPFFPLLVHIPHFSTVGFVLIGVIVYKSGLRLTLENCDIGVLCRCINIIKYLSHYFNTILSKDRATAKFRRISVVIIYIKTSQILNKFI